MAMSDAIDVDVAIDRNRMSGYQLAIVCLCTLAMMFDGYANQTIGVIGPSIARDLGLSAKDFGPVYSAGLFGIMLGALIMGPVADRFGRRWSVIVSAVLFGLFMLVSTSATSIGELTVYRFLTGLGIGGAMPNLVAIATEFAPSRLERRIVGWVFTGIPAGAVLGGIVSSLLLPVAGWRSVLYVGGGISLLLALFLMVWLPESVRFLITARPDPERIEAIMRRVLPGHEIPQGSRFHSSHTAPKGMPVGHLFMEHRTLDTLLFWVAFFMNLLILYFVLSWFTTMLEGAGMAVTEAIIAVTMFSVGGAVGTATAGYLMDAIGPRAAVIWELMLTAVLIVALAVAHSSFWFVVVAISLLGLVVQGAQAGLNALVAAYYPTSIRSTGLGWALGIGRIGSIVGPLVGGLMLSLAWTNERIFMSGMIPAAIAALAVAAIVVRHRKAASMVKPAQ
jgi:AAHS family 4-hydroxybenzoate transporter-like MFS transporter